MNAASERPYSVNSLSDVGIEVTDEDLKKLADSFAKGRDELQKKIDSLLNEEISNKKEPHNIKISPKESLKIKNEKYPGIPIDLKTAKLLRELTVSSCVHSLSSDWKKAKFAFRHRESELTYGLYSEKNGTKGFILCVQANIIKNIIIKSYADTNSSGSREHEKILLRPSEIEKKLLLIESLSSILWNAGEKQYACVTLNKNSKCFTIETEGIKGSLYVPDGITENLYLYEFRDLKALNAFIKSNIASFQSPEGCIVFLYSLILSRQIDKIKKDLQGESLLGDMEECKIGLFNLVLNGVAIPYLHNGTAWNEVNGISKVGMNFRSEIGILYFDSKEEEKKRTEVESMLKVPKFPIWLSIMGKNQLALLFHTNLSLLSDWRYERNFSLHFYSPILKQETEHRLNIDTREEYLDMRKCLQLKYPSLKFFEEEKEPEIEKVLATKWPNCLISGADELMTLL